MLDVGRMNKRITFYQYKESTDAYNRTVQKLQSFKTVWGSVEPTTGKEYYDAQKVRNEQTYKIFTRYNSSFDTNKIIGYKNRKFKIVSMINYGESNELLQFVCTEIVGDGLCQIQDSN